MNEEDLGQRGIALSELFDRKLISIDRGAIFDVTPPPLNLADLRRNERIEGMLIGVAVGDALGHSTEWKYDSETRHKQFGTILDHVGSPQSTPGRISDDSQLTFWTVEHLLRCRAFDFDDLAKCFAERRHRIVGQGKNTAASLRRHSERISSGRPARHDCAGDPVDDGRGNGSLMRFSPLILPYLKHPSPKLWTDVTLSSLITHGHASSISATLAFTHLLWKLLERPVGSTPEPEWWLDEYVRVASDVEKSPITFYLGSDPVPLELQDFKGTLWQLVDDRVRRTWRKGISIAKACSLSGFGSRADIIQTVPAVLMILMHHADSFESAIIAAINDTKDNDTIGAIVGALLGALHGRRQVRQKWIDGIRSQSLELAGMQSLSDREVVLQVARTAARRFGGVLAGEGLFDSD